MKFIMKNKTLLFTTIALFLLIGVTRCEKEKEITFPDAIIIKELSKLDILGSNTESIVIQSQKELDAIFSKSEMQRYEELQQIDFSKNTLLLGFGRYGNEVSNMQHYFIKTGTSSYTYLLKIAGDATRPDAFRYGIIVAKLPKATEVTFLIDELHCEIPNCKDAYDYPIKPGSEGWKQLKTREEMVAVCQIPDDILNNMSTEGLIESVLNNPLYGSIFLANVPQQCFNSFYDDFSSVQVLMQRSDLAEKLLDRYYQMNPSCEDNNWPSLNGAGSGNDRAFSMIELLIAQNAVLEQIIDNQETKSFLQQVLTIYDGKIINNYSMVGFIYSMLICGRMMYLSEYAPFVEEYNNNDYIRGFVGGANSSCSKEVLDIINNYTNNFLEEIR